MPHVLLEWQFTTASAKALMYKPHDRTALARTLVESFGGKLHQYFFAFGDCDGIGIAEFPDRVSALAFSMKAASTGAFSRFETRPLFTAKEAEEAMKKARDTKSDYRP